MTVHTVHIYHILMTFLLQFPHLFRPLSLFPPFLFLHYLCIHIEIITYVHAMNCPLESSIICISNEFVSEQSFHWDIQVPLFIFLALMQLFILKWVQPTNSDWALMLCFFSSYFLLYDFVELMCLLICKYCLFDIRLLFWFPSAKAELHDLQ